MPFYFFLTCAQNTGTKITPYLKAHPGTPERKIQAMKQGKGQILKPVAKIVEIKAPNRNIRCVCICFFTGILCIYSIFQKSRDMPHFFIFS